MNPQDLPPKPAHEVDFPIERVEAEHVSRREFAKFLCLVSGGMAAGTGWVAMKGSFLPTFKLTGEVRVCATHEVPVGGTHAFSLEGTKMPYILVRPSENEWFAYEQKCTHLSCAVYYSPATDRIECPCHKGYFDVRSGKVLQGPPPRPLHRLDVLIKGNDVFVTERRHA